MKGINTKANTTLFLIIMLLFLILKDQLDIQLVIAREIFELSRDLARKLKKP